MIRTPKGNDKVGGEAVLLLSWVVWAGAKRTDSAEQSCPSWSVLNRSTIIALHFLVVLWISIKAHYNTNVIVQWLFCYNKHAWHETHWTFWFLWCPFLEGDHNKVREQKLGNNSGKKIIEIIQVTDNYGIWYHREINILKIGQAEEEKLSALSKICKHFSAHYSLHLDGGAYLLVLLFVGCLRFACLPPDSKYFPTMFFLNSQSAESFPLTAIRCAIWFWWLPKRELNRDRTEHASFGRRQPTPGSQKLSM